MKKPLQNLLFKAAGTAALFTALLSGNKSAAQATATPVTITSGFNQDIIANGTGNASASTTMGFDQQNNRALVSLDFKATASSAFPTYGLPSNGTITSATTSGVTFQLGSYSANNVLFLTPSYVGNGAPSTGTLSFSTSNVSTIYLLAGATGGGYQYVPFSATINFSDNTTQANTSLTATDWYNGPGYAIQGIGRINTTNNNLEGDALNPNLYEIAIPINDANLSKTITGITFSFPGDSSAEWANEIRLNVLAVSAQAAPASIDITTQNSVPASINTNGGTLQLNATVTPSSAGVAAWSIVSGAANATISQTGLVTAVNNGIVTVKATLNTNANIYDEITINITNQAVEATGVTVSVEDNAPATITTNGGTLQLEATVAPADATDTDVTWAVTAGGAFASVDQNGLVTAIANGTATITATTADGGFTDTIDVVITGQTVAVSGITLTVANDAPAAITTNLGTLQLVATLTPQDATNTNVTWAVTAGSAFASVDENGLVTAIANGTATVTVTTVDGGFTDTIDVVISGQYVAATSVTITVENDAQPVITAIGNTLQLEAAVAPADATDTDVTWTVTSGAEYASVSSTGLVTAVANGTAVIRATTNEGVFGEITVTVDTVAGLSNFETAIVKAYPNPTTAIVNITSEEPIKALTVYDSFGRTIFTSSNKEVNLTQVNTGVYFISIILENNTSATLKVVKQ